MARSQADIGLASPLAASNRLAPAVSVAAVAVLLALLLAAVGQPVFTDDAWIHMALGRSFLADGPWLAEDPLLFTAPGPPVPAAWLFDIWLYALSELGGFQTLRIVHVALVLCILALAASLLRRASGSIPVSALGVAVFAVTAAYRLVQLRPHLFSILFALVIYRLVIEGGRTPSVARCAIAVVVMALWANIHAAFLLGPLIVATALGASLAAQLLQLQAPSAELRARSLRLLGVAVLGLLATFANPSLADPHLAWFIAGSDTPSLQRVADEWLAVNPLALPRAGLPPAPLTWILFWGLLIATPLAALRATRALRQHDAAFCDPALVLLGLGTLLAPLVAVRFLWLVIFPLLLIASTLPSPTPRRHWAMAVAAAALVPAFLFQGTWPMISKGLSGGLEGYVRPYPASKYYGHAVWFLDDADLEGNLFNDYFLGGFLGYWLSPEIKTFANGTLNLRPEAMEANLPIRIRRAVEGVDESFEDLLERQEIDLFLGIHLPEAKGGGRPWYYTTGHLERTPGWIPIFRNLRCSVYLRLDPRNERNLEKVEAYYRKLGVPFDPGHGFDPLAAAARNPRWAVANGIISVQHRQTLANTRAQSPTRRIRGLSHLAAWYTALGAYERAAQLDAELLELRPAATGAMRRRAWTLLKLGDYAGAARYAAELEASADGLARLVGRKARELAIDDAGPEEGRATVARLPIFTSAEAKILLQGFSGPATR